MRKMVARRRSTKKAFIKVTQNSQKNPHSGDLEIDIRKITAFGSLFKNKV